MADRSDSFGEVRTKNARARVRNAKRLRIIEFEFPKRRTAYQSHLLDSLRLRGELLDRMDSTEFRGRLQAQRWQAQAAHAKAQGES